MNCSKVDSCCGVDYLPSKSTCEVWVTRCIIVTSIALGALFLMGNVEALLRLSGILSASTAACGPTVAELINGCVLEGLLIAGAAAHLYFRGWPVHKNSASDQIQEGEE